MVAVDKPAYLQLPTGEFNSGQSVIEDDTWSGSIIPDTGQRNDSSVDRKRLAELSSLHPIVVSTESRESAR
jgi:hypothetical protein